MVKGEPIRERYEVEMEQREETSTYATNSGESGETKLSSFQREEEVVW